VGRKPEMFAGFEVNKPVRLVPEIELLFLTVVGYMKKEHFMFVVFQVLKGFKKFVGAFLFNQIAKQNNQRAFMNILGNHVEGFNRIGFFVQRCLFLPQQSPQLMIKHIDVNRRQACFGVKVDIVGEKRKSYGIALPAQKVNDSCG
jgi:hypothetical protein